MIVLDASALLAFLFREAGHERVGPVVDSACISSVNLSEVIGRFTRDGHDAREVLERILDSRLEIAPFLAEDAAMTAALLPGTQPLGLSLGDRACITLAAMRKAAAWTADRSWLSLDLAVKVEVIR